MRVPYTWLKDFIEIELTAEELAETLTRAGIEVDEIVTLAPRFSEVVVAEVISIDKHPQADKLFVTQVSDGQDTMTVVAGIDNIKAGDKVPLAKPGAKLPGDVKIKRTKLRGIESHGMLCSAEELALSLNPGINGILVLDPETPVGQPLADALGLNDPILILDLTPNRADCLGLVGVAKEVAALTGKRVQLPDNTLTINLAQAEQIVPKIRIESPELCARYTGLVIKDIKIALSPIWLQIRLLQAGVRPISNIVDVTNYVMWEWGQPLHAFDYQTLAAQTIVVRRAETEEKLVTLDNNERSLSNEMLVIADAEQAVAIAGVMGGLATEITDETQAVLLESAHFNPVSIRRTGRSLGMYSEAQQRFEKGVDVNGCVNAMQRAARLIELLGAGSVAGEIVDEYAAPSYPRQVRLRPERARKLLGLEISQREMTAIFQRQGFTVEEGTYLHVMVPTLRADLQEEVDLIEEVARIYGYDKIDTSLPGGQLIQGRLTEKQRALAKTRQLLVACGLNEAICYSFVSPQQFDKLNLTAADPLRKTLTIANPLSDEQSVMRTMLTGGLLDALVYNQNRNQHNVKLFELGTVFLAADVPLAQQPEEKTMLGLALMGSFPAEHWQEKPQAVDFYTLKGIVENLFARLGVTGYSFKASELSWCQPGQTAEVWLDDVKLGWLGHLHPEALDNYDLAQPVFVAELDMHYILARVQLVAAYSSLPRYPAVLRDLAVVVPDDTTAAEVVRVIREAGGKLVEDVALFDQYRGEQIPQGHRSLAFAVTYRDADRTLNDQEVTKVHQQIEAALGQLLGAGLRG
ncbi:MAG TPA: phenylalanine--tRNA ligase subunit beta [Oscillospiraceae bacterium]|nr:phenylalanine--tRNA ligase subunit beta [Oscillospiraceae bacterium]